MLLRNTNPALALFHLLWSVYLDVLTKKKPASCRQHVRLPEAFSYMAPDFVSDAHSFTLQHALHGRLSSAALRFPSQRFPFTVLYRRSHSLATTHMSLSTERSYYHLTLEDDGFRRKGGQLLRFPSQRGIFPSLAVAFLERDISFLGRCA